MNHSIRKVCVARDFDDTNLHKKVGLDVGKDMMKVTLSLFPDDEVKNGGAKKKKKQFKNTGNRRVLILAIAPKVSETYSNLQTILGLLKLRLLESYWITGLNVHWDVLF